MSKYLNVKVKATLYTDFYIEVSDDATPENILDLAQRETILPHNYPHVLDDYLKRNFNIHVKGLDSMLKAWDIDDIEYKVDPEDFTDGGDIKVIEGE